MEEMLYEPIKRKLLSWMSHYNNKPALTHRRGESVWDEYRKKNSLECILTNGNLNADTLFSLWMPLRFTLVAINGYAKIKKLAGNMDKRSAFLEKLIEDDVLRELLPKDNARVVKLSKLFELGQTGANVMILPKRWMQKRGNAPYYGYMPYFLHECFRGGEFSHVFETEEKLIEWIFEQNLQMFFANNEIKRKNIIDLAGSGDVKNSASDEIDVLITNYIDILQKRKNLMEQGVSDGVGAV